MKIVVLNGSPKGKNSVTIQTSYYLEKRYPEHSFEVLHVGARIRAYEKEFASAKVALEAADMVLFSYPVYTFLAPYQLHRFMELLKASGTDLRGKYATQISTSKHFYDVTAHKWVEENAYDLGMKYLGGLSADMEDLRQEKGLAEADCYFEKLMFDAKHDIYKVRTRAAAAPKTEPYQPVLENTPKSADKSVVMVTNVSAQDINLQNMIADVKAACPYPIKVVNMREFAFSGGCLGCLQCATTEQCVYKDGFDEYLRKEIQTADAIINAFTIQDHYTEASLKCYDDRQFCNGHRTVTQGMPVAYLISGDYQNEPLMQMLVEARSEVGGVYLAGVATDEGDIAADIQKLMVSLQYALTHTMAKPTNFYGVGGSKIFRDLVYQMRGMMKADHKFYKSHGVYDFPHNQPFKILQMQLVGAMLSVPSVQKKMKGKLSSYIIAPYTKIIENTKPANQKEDV
ncbi:MAG: NAD(P)H-dependent oxidoreductase [Faecalibacterium sp.]